MLTAAPPRVKIISLISNPVTLSEKVMGICGNPALPTDGTAPMVPLGGVVSLGVGVGVGVGVGFSFTSVTLTVTTFSAVRPGFPLSVATTVKV